MTSAVMTFGMVMHLSLKFSNTDSMSPCVLMLVTIFCKVEPRTRKLLNCTSNVPNMMSLLLSLCVAMDLNLKLPT